MPKLNKISIEKLNTKDLDKKNNIYYETILLLFIFCILIIDFFSPFGSIEIIAPQFLYLAFINIITGVFLYKNQTLISNGFVAVFKKSILFKAYIGFLLLCSITLLSANNFSLAIVNFMQLLLFFVCL